MEAWKLVNHVYIKILYSSLSFFFFINLRQNHADLQKPSYMVSHPTSTKTWFTDFEYMIIEF